MPAPEHLVLPAGIPREIHNLLFRETGICAENPSKLNTCLVRVEGALKHSLHHPPLGDTACLAALDTE